MDDWVMIFSSSDGFRLELAKGILDENEIPAVIINKKDSAYLFGEMELYVGREDVLRAKHLIEELTD